MRDWARQMLPSKAGVMETMRKGRRVYEAEIQILELTSSSSLLRYMLRVERYIPWFKHGRRFQLYGTGVPSSDLLMCTLGATGVSDANVQACLEFGQQVEKSAMVLIANNCGWACVEHALSRLGWELAQDVVVRNAVLRAAVRHGKTSVLETLSEEWIQYNEKDEFYHVVTTQGAHAHRIDVLEWARDRGKAPSEDRLINATYGLHKRGDEEATISTLEYIATHAVASEPLVRLECLKDAARMGKVKVARWVRAHLLPAREHMEDYAREMAPVLDAAVRGGHLCSVRYAMEELLLDSLTEYSMSFPICRGNTAIMDYITKTDSCTDALVRACIRYTIHSVPHINWRVAFETLYKHGMIPDASHMAEAARLGHADVMEFLHAHGCGMDERTLIEAAKGRYQRPIEFATGKGLVITRTVLQCARGITQRNSDERARFLGWLERQVTGQ